MIEQSIDTTLEICYSIYIRLIDLGYKEYPSSTCKELIEILIKVNQGIINNLEQKKEKIGKDVIEEKYRDEYEESVRREIIWCNKSLNFLHFLIQYVEESNVYQDRIYVKLGTPLILHPNELILGSTFEYVKFPNDLIGYILGRSSWGRIGLVIATATFINPGFAGVITLELANLGNTPISLYPGIKIAQISLHRVNLEKINDTIVLSKYFGSIRPEFSKIHEDKDWESIKKMKNYTK